MEVQPKKPPIKGPADWFTGEVWIDPIANGRDGSALAVSAVHFHPGARTAWHSHSRGQTLHVTEGQGLIQTRGEPIAPLHTGDVVYAPADEWHWHGATPEHFMSHVSITEGSAAWGDHVTDEEYRG